MPSCPLRRVEKAGGRIEGHGYSLRAKSLNDGRQCETRSRIADTLVVDTEYDVKQAYRERAVSNKLVPCDHGQESKRVSCSSRNVEMEEKKSVFVLCGTSTRVNGWEW